MSLIIMLLNRILGIKNFNIEPKELPYEQHENRMGMPNNVKESN